MTVSVLSSGFGAVADQVGALLGGLAEGIVLVGAMRSCRGRMGRRTVGRRHRGRGRRSGRPSFPTEASGPGWPVAPVRRRPGSIRDQKVAIGDQPPGVTGFGAALAASILRAWARRLRQDRCAATAGRPPGCAAKRSSFLSQPAASATITSDRLPPKTGASKADGLPGGETSAISSGRVGPNFHRRQGLAFEEFLRERGAAGG